MSSEHVTELKAQLYSAEREIERLEKELAKWKGRAGAAGDVGQMLKDRAEAAEASLTALRAHVGVLMAFIRTIAENTWTSDKPGKAKALLSATPPDAVKVVAEDNEALVEMVAKAIAADGFGRPWDDFLETNAFDTDRGDLREYAAAAIAAVTDLTGEDKP